MSAPRCDHTTCSTASPRPTMDQNTEARAKAPQRRGATSRRRSSGGYNSSDFCYTGLLMPRPATASIQSIIDQAVNAVLERFSESLDRAVAEELRKQPAALGKVRRTQKRMVAVARPPRGAEITRWIADRRARRVPTFVVELTGGVDTKKKIVAKYGADVVFEKGKPAPKVGKAA